MTDRILKLKEAQGQRLHHQARQTDLPDPSPYRQKDLPDHLRAAIRLQTALNHETPLLTEHELIAFTRTVDNLLPVFSDEEWTQIKNNHTIHEKGNVCNLSPDYSTVLRLGLHTLKARLSHSPYHEAMRISIDAVLDLTRRYRDLAADQGSDELAHVLDRVPAHGATTFREALQSLRILHFAMWCDGCYHNTLGRFDQYMMPYLKQDLERGLITEDQAFELLEAFFLSCNRDSDLYPGMQRGDNGQSMVLGGITPEGQDGFNLLSEMCLKASAELMLIDPKINLRVSKETPLSVYAQGTRLTRLGLGFPQYLNDDIIISGLIRLGYAPEDARDYAVAACWEPIIPGKGMDIPNIQALPFANVTNHAIQTTLSGAAQMQDILCAIEAAIFSHVEQTLSQLHDLYIIPSPYLSLFFEGCVEAQKDISQGCKYNNFGLHGTGLATATDMLAAVNKIIFQEKGNPQTLLAALKDNFLDYGQLHERLKHDCPKMGNDDDEADRYAVFLLDCFSRSVQGYRNERGGIIRAGTGSAMYYLWHANELEATSDGRLAGMPLSANYAPSLNVKLNGPLSLIRSFTKPALEKVINGGPLTLEFSDTVFRNNEAIEKVARLVQMFISLGGHQLQLNTVNREALLDAQKHPEKYQNLIVRVWGWSGYFVELDKCYQDHIISRVELDV